MLGVIKKIIKMPLTSFDAVSGLEVLAVFTMVTGVSTKIRCREIQ